MKGKMGKIVFIIIIVIILGAFLLRVPILFTRYFDPDEFQHLHAAFSIYHGMVPYRDFFEHHTPLTLLLILPFYHILGPSISLIFAVRIMMMLFTEGILYLTYLSGKRFYNAQVGLLAVLMLSCMIMFLDEHHLLDRQTTDR